MSLLNEKEELAVALKSRKLFTILFVVASALYVTALLLCLFATGDNYAPFLYLLFGLTIAYVWFAIYCWSAAFPAQSRRIEFFSAAIEGPSEEHVLVYQSKVKENVYKDGLYATLCRGGYRENGKDYDFEFYLPHPAPELEEGKKIKIQTFRRMVLSLEVLP